MLSRERTLELLALLGLSGEDFGKIRAEANEGRARALLEDVQLRAKRGYKRAALDLHPDRTGGDDAKAETFKLLGALLGEIEALQVVRRPPASRMQVWVTVSGSAWSSTTNNVTWGG